jgi:hypothetical protein
MLPVLIYASQASAATPALEVFLPEGKAVPKAPYAVQYVISWDGAPNEWAIIPPNVEPPDWGTATVTNVDSTHTGDRNTVTFEVVYTPEEPGSYPLPELAFFYDPPAALAEADTEAAVAADAPEGGAALIAPRQTLEVSPPPPLWLIPAIIAAAVLSLAVVGLLLWRRHKQKRKPSRGPSPVDQMQDALHTARRRRLDGDLYAYYRELVRATEFVADDAEAKQLLDKFKTRTQEVGYKGMRPSDDILDGDMRDVERVLARRKEEFGP